MISVIAAVLAVAVLFGRPVLAKAIARPRTAAFVLSVAAAALSAFWIAAYLRGGPRIIDATAYYLSGRAMSEGHLSWPAHGIPAAITGRFLLSDAGTYHHDVSVIFPPGFPAVLALGFLVGAPMAVGPVLAALVTWLTFDLTRTAARSANGDQGVELAILAASLSVVCGALRYHTADTMSHGLAAVCVTAALTCALRLRYGRGWGWALLAGAAIGLAIATRPVSGLALTALVALAIGRAISLRLVSAVVVAAAPGVALLLLHQRAATGAMFSSAQALYYAVSDGPAGCFRYGFGADIGCRFEHGDFVAANLPSGYGLIEAIGTTLRRLKMHGIDALNAEPLAIALVLPAIWLAIRSPGRRALGMALPVFVLAYAPFYFDGNYPGGGARFFADVLPVEHAVIALALPAVITFLRARVAKVKALDLPRATVGLVALSLVGFALRAEAQHAALRDREGGRPMFRPAEVEPSEGGVLVFVNTDHGFLLGFDPDARADEGGVEVARYRGDANDTWLWEARGRPRTVRHRYDVSTGWVFVEPFTPTETRKLSAESFWPALEQTSGFAVPAWGSGECGEKRVLRITPGRDGRALVELPLPRRIRGDRVTATLAVDPDAHAQIALGSEIGSGRSFVPLRGSGPCLRSDPLEPNRYNTSLTIESDAVVDLVSVEVDLAVD